MAGIKVTGLDKLQKALKDNVTMDDVKRVVKHNGSELQEKMQDYADFKKGYQTGETKRSIGLEILDGGFTAESGPETDYSPYVEYGTRFMDAQPFVKPAHDEQKGKFKSDLQKLMK
jgi:HK97 gp10 family phage protein